MADSVVKVISESSDSTVKVPTLGDREVKVLQAGTILVPSSTTVELSEDEGNDIERRPDGLYSDSNNQPDDILTAIAALDAAIQ